MYVAVCVGTASQPWLICGSWLINCSLGHLLEYIHVVQFHIPSPRSGWGAYAILCFMLSKNSVRFTEIHLYKYCYSLHCLENVCSYSTLVHFHLIVWPKKSYYIGGSGRCLFRHMPPRISEIHTFTDSVFSFWMCTVGWRMCCICISQCNSCLSLNQIQNGDEKAIYNI